MSNPILLVNLMDFSVCCDPHKGFSVINEAEVDVSPGTLLLSP